MNVYSTIGFAGQVSSGGEGREEESEKDAFGKHLGIIERHTGRIDELIVE